MFWYRLNEESAQRLTGNAGCISLLWLFSKVQKQKFLTETKIRKHSLGRCLKKDPRWMLKPSAFYLIGPFSWQMLCFLSYDWQLVFLNTCKICHNVNLKRQTCVSGFWNESWKVKMKSNIEEMCLLLFQKERNSGLARSWNVYGIHGTHLRLPSGKELMGWGGLFPWKEKLVR